MTSNDIIKTSAYEMRSLPAIIAPSESISPENSDTCTKSEPENYKRKHEYPREYNQILAPVYARAIVRERSGGRCEAAR